MDRIIIDCDVCIMRRTTACADCVVTHVCDNHFGDLRQSEPQPGRPERTESGESVGSDAIVFDLAEHRALHLFAEAGLVPTLRHRDASKP